jgi:ribose transport system substrate-binding protein
MIFSKRAVGRGKRFFVACAALVLCAATHALAADSPSISPAAKAVVDFDKAGVKPTKQYRIGYLTECVDNTYCLARLAGLKAAAEKYGFTYKIFDAAFNPATQAKGFRTPSPRALTPISTDRPRPRRAAASTSAS